MHKEARINLSCLRGRLKNWFKKIKLKTHDKKFAEDIDLADPTPLTDQVCLRCTQREAKVNHQSRTE